MQHMSLCRLLVSNQHVAVAELPLKRRDLTSANLEFLKNNNFIPNRPRIPSAQPGTWQRVDMSGASIDLRFEWAALCSLSTPKRLFRTVMVV